MKPKSDGVLDGSWVPAISATRRQAAGPQLSELICEGLMWTVRSVAKAFAGAIANSIESGLREIVKVVFQSERLALTGIVPPTYRILLHDFRSAPAAAVQSAAITMKYVSVRHISSDFSIGWRPAADNSFPPGGA